MKKQKHTRRCFVGLICAVMIIMFIFPIVACARGVSTSYDYDMLIQDDWILIFFSNFALMAVIEVFFGYLIFFRTLRGVISILIANIISYPLFVIWLHLTANYLLLGRFVGGDADLALLIGAIGVIFIEMAVIKMILNGRITKKYAFLISLCLNFITGTAYLLLRLFS